MQNEEKKNEDWSPLEVVKDARFAFDVDVTNYELIDLLSYFIKSFSTKEDFKKFVDDWFRM